MHEAGNIVGIGGRAFTLLQLCFEVCMFLYE